MKIFELVLLTNNLLNTKKFYTEILAFEVVQESKMIISFKVGSSVLTFKLTDEELKPKYHFAFLIPHNKINEAKNWLSIRTDLIKNENSFVTNFENWDAEAVYLFDNNRNILEFICRKALDNSSDNQFTENSIININEVGLVADNPLLIAEKIFKASKTDFFSKGPKRQDFCAVGNDEGLFVISNPNRSWYPTDEKAEKWLVQGSIETMGKIHNFKLDGSQISFYNNEMSGVS